jgi:phosphate-selective porin OprO/OprP
MIPSVVRVALAAFVILIPAHTFAQSAAPVAAQPSTQPPASPVSAGWQNGFFIQSANGDFRLQLGTVVQTDGRFSLDDVKPVINTFSVRKARIILSGRVGKYFDYRFMPDLGNGTVNVLDAYFDVRFSPAFRVRLGKDKSPVGHEVLVGDAALVFPERALPSSLLPNRDIGVQVQGDLAGGKVYYAGGVFNGIVDGTSSTTELDTNNGKDLAGRIAIQPFRRNTAPGPLHGLGFQVGGTRGKQTGALPSFRTSIGQSWFSYAAAAGATPAATAGGLRTRITPAVFYYQKIFGVFAEYARSEQVVVRGGEPRTIANAGWDVTGVVNLTGENASAGLVTPKHAFDPPTHQWGALQAVARDAELKVDAAAFDAGVAAASASRKAQQLTLGVNWYPIQYIKYYVNYERTVFDGGAADGRPTENAIFLRMQLAF